jgi:hypothetical protein
MEKTTSYADLYSMRVPSLARLSKAMEGILSIRSGNPFLLIASAMMRHRIIRDYAQTKEA